MQFIKKIKEKIEQKKKIKKRKKLLKRVRKFFRKLTKKEVLTKLIIGFMGFIMLASAILPYILR